MQVRDLQQIPLTDDPFQAMAIRRIEEGRARLHAPRAVAFVQWKASKPALPEVDCLLNRSCTPKVAFNGFDTARNADKWLARALNASGYDVRHDALRADAP